jgi:Na+-transporting methylmalonyl-CoA/oxaloacetate decarboxylase gamma subunit
MDGLNGLVELIKLMLMSMGVIFLFLMITKYQLVLKLIRGVDPIQNGEPKAVYTEWKPITEDDNQIVAAITAAIIHHNNRG